MFGGCVDECAGVVSLSVWFMLFSETQTATRAVIVCLTFHLGNHPM